jgi:hypothetical protein
VQRLGVEQQTVKIEQAGGWNGHEAHPLKPDWRARVTMRR